MLRVHRKADYLPDVFATISGLARAGETVVSVMADRPSAEVLTALSRFDRASGVTLSVIPAPFDVARNYSAAAQFQFEHLLTYEGVQFACLLDDDVFLEPAGIEEINGHLGADEPPDILQVETVFLWDSRDNVNSRFPTHLSDFVFRVLPGDVFPDDLVTHAPDGIRVSGRRTRLRHPLHHLGYLTARERRDAWDRARATGKIDAHTTALIQTPILRPIHGPE